MASDDKLIADVKAALTAAGFVNVTTSADDSATTLSGERGSAGAVFHVTTQRGAKAALLSTATGGPNADAGKLDIVTAPNVADLQRQITADPAGTATQLRLSPELLRQAIAAQPKA